MPSTGSPPPPPTGCVPGLNRTGRTGTEAREAQAIAIGTDGFALLGAVYAPGAPAWLRELPAVETLRRVWVQNDLYVADGNGGRALWRADGAIPPSSQFISSPHDGDAHYARKRSTQWVGYRVHVTETCDEEIPCLVTQVETTPGPSPTETRRRSSTPTSAPATCSLARTPWTPATW